MIKEMISIVIPNYNYAKFLPECIESVINQTYKNWEIIYVDDNSTDNSREIVRNYIKKYPELKIRMFHNKKGPSGTPTPINIGIKNMKGEYFAWLSSDDIMKPNRLEQQFEIYNKNPHFGMIFTGFDEFNDKTEIRKICGEDYNFENREDFFLHLMKWNFINGNTILIKKEILNKVGLFIEYWKKLPHIWMSSEYLKWLEIALKFRIFYIKEPIHLTRAHQENSKYYNSRLNVELRKVILSEISKKNPPSKTAKYFKFDLKRAEKFETQFIINLSNFKLISEIVERMEKLKKWNVLVYKKVKHSFEKISKIKLIARLAVFYILKNNGYENFPFKSIDIKNLAYIDFNEIYSIASVLKKANVINESLTIFQYLEKKDNLPLDLISATYFHIGEIFFIKKLYGDAKEYFTKCLSINAKHNKAKELLSRIKG